MPEISHEDVTCPHCGAQAPFTMYPYVDAVRQQELKMRCLNGKVFEFHCPSCGRMSHIGYPMCYHDSDQRLMILVLRERDPLFSAGMITLTQLQYKVSDMDQYTERAVPTPAYLAEKVDLFSYCLDDRTVEIQKFLLMPKVRSQFADTEIAALLLRLLDDALNYVVIDQEGTVIATIPFDREAYDELHAQCSPFYSDDPLDAMCVDAKWAEAYFTPDDRLQ